MVIIADLTEPRYTPGTCVHTVKHRYHEGRIVYLEPAIETNDLGDSSNGQQDESKDGRCMAELIAGILVRQTASNQLHTTAFLNIQFDTKHDEGLTRL